MPSKPDAGRPAVVDRPHRRIPVPWVALICVVAAAVASSRQASRPVSIPPAPAIRVDQAGYPSHSPKMAIVVDASNAVPTAHVRNGAGERIATLTIGPGRVDEQSGDRVRAIDFSRVTTPGTYVIVADGLGESDPVRIGGDVYRRPLYLALRSFYGQRCGTTVDLGQEFPGYRYAACHLEDGLYHASSGRSGRRAATKGWHDAGDYGKYIVNSGITVGELLWAWEWYPSALRTLRLDIPESGDAVPDVLDEIRWNLDWMLGMQDEDGGVWHKLTSEGFGSFVMPDADDGGPRYVIGTGAVPFKSTCATADFAAVAAMAARAWREPDPAFADRTLRAARRAWDWAQAKPDVLFRNPPGVSTGAYGDHDCGDERLWASAELLRTTGEPAFERAARALAAAYHVNPVEPQWWQNVANLGLWAYALADAAVADPSLQQRIRAETTAAAQEIVRRTGTSGWRHSLTDENFVWGSNGVAANYGVLLLAASRISGDRAFRDAALDHLHYVLGRNTFGLSWITGVGTRPFQHPHHRPSGADANPLPWPGLLSGGPNRNGGDAVLDALPKTPPARRYADAEESYAGNENAINWNAALVFLLAGLHEPEAEAARSATAPHRRVGKPSLSSPSSTTPQIR